MTDTDIIKRFIHADNEVKKCSAALKKAEGARDDLEAEVMAWFSQNGVSNIDILGRVAKLKKTYKVLPAKGKTAADVIEAMRQCGLSDLINAPSYHWSRMASLARKAEEEGEEIPEELLAVIRIEETFKPTTTKGKVKK